MEGIVSFRFIPYRADVLHVRLELQGPSASASQEGLNLKFVCAFGEVEHLVVLGETALGECGAKLAFFRKVHQRLEALARLLHLQLFTRPTGHEVESP